MRPSDDHSPPRRPIFFPVVIATVFLTIIGMTGGFVLGERHNQRVREAANNTVTGGAGTPEQTPPTAPPTRPEPAFGKTCPEAAVATAKKLGLRDDLVQVLKVETDNGSTVWICEDGDGNLHYQSKTGGLDKPLDQGENGLFLSNVKRLAEHEYEATAANGNRFLVSRESLVVLFANGKQQRNEVLDFE